MSAEISQKSSSLLPEMRVSLGLIYCELVDEKIRISSTERDSKNSFLFEIVLLNSPDDATSL